MALAAYRRDHGGYPEVLHVLAPKYLDAVPVDLFSGRPLNYRLQENGYQLHSVGPNEIDEGGASFRENPSSDDVRIRVPIQVRPR